MMRLVMFEKNVIKRGRLDDVACSTSSSMARAYERRYQRYIVTGPGRYWAQEYESMHVKFFCNQAQHFLCKPLANITIILFLNLNNAYCDYYANRLCKFRRGSQ